MMKILFRYRICHHQGSRRLILLRKILDSAIITLLYLYEMSDNKWYRI